jgi:hypothetical protein
MYNGHHFSLSSSSLPVQTLLVPVAQLHALLKAVRKRALASSSALGERHGATKWTRSRTVAYAHDTDIRGTGDSCVASHASGHLDLHLKLGVGCEGDALNAETGNVLDDSGFLHSGLVGSARCAVDIGCEGTSAVLVDLAKSHSDGSVFCACWQPGCCSSAHGGGNASFGRTADFVAASTEEACNAGCAASTTCTACSSALVTAAEEAAEKLALLLLDVVFDTDAGGGSFVGRRRGTSAHEGADHDGCVDGTVALGAAERSGFAAGNVAVSDDGSVGLGSTAARALLVCNFCTRVKLILTWRSSHGEFHLG